MIPKKSLGQNFLIDKNICKKIVNLTNLKDKLVIEVGPGTAQLTDEILLKQPKKIILIEKDLELSNLLNSKYQNNELFKIYNQDVLNFNFQKYKKIIFISNLPYNISTKILYKLIRYRNNFSEIILMLQKEVAEKLQYNQDKKINKHSFIINTFFNFKIMFGVTNKVFYPRPKVKSSVVKITIKKDIKIDLDKLLFFTNKIFLYKRKKISNILKDYQINKIDDKILNMRTEDISSETLLKVFKEF